MLAYDGSEVSVKALGRAVELARVTPEASLDIVHVYEYPRFFVGEGIAPIPASVNKEIFDLAEQTTNELKERMAEAGVEGNVHMIQGSPADVILEYTVQHDVDLIVIGSRGLNGIREFVLGSVSHNVVQHAGVPVLVIK
nr:universal stress protein [Paenibacillus lemnae]